MAKAKSRELSSGLDFGQQGPNYFKQHHYVSGSALAGNWSQELRLGIEPTNFGLGCRNINQHLKNQTKCLPPHQAFEL